jgi:hypothetical protein
MKKYFSLLALLLGFGFLAEAQVCLKPVPLTSQQVQVVAGKWKGTYTNSTGQQDIEINIYVKTGNDVICEVSNPPLPGKETDVEYFFCPGGEFHMRKFVGDISYVFQAVPENGQMKGMISSYDKDLKRTKIGDFVLVKQL